MSDYNTYINTIDVIEDSVIDDTKFPIVRDTKLKQIFRVMLEFLKVIIEGSLEVKLPTIWTDEKQSRAEAERRERLEERRVEEKE